MRILRFPIPHLLLLINILLLVPTTRGQQSSEQLASQYFQNKEYDKATELYQTLYTQTSNKFYYQMLCQCYVQQHLWREAEQLVKKRQKRTPNDLSLYVHLATLYNEQGEKKKANKTLNEALTRITANQSQVQELASELIQNGYLEHAEKAYLEVRKKTNNPFLYLAELANLYDKMGRYDLMMNEFFNLLDQSPSSMGSIQLSLQNILSETSNPQLTSQLRTIIMERLDEQPNRKEYLEMMIWYSIQQKDFAFALTQAQAVSHRFPDMGSDWVLRVASIAEHNDDLPTALSGYEYITCRGKDDPHYLTARVGALNVMYTQINQHHAVASDRLDHLKNEYETAFIELGKIPQTVPLMRNYAHLLAYEANELQQAVDLLYDIIEMRRLPQNTIDETKLELGDLLLFAGEVWDASLLYSQVEKAEKETILGAQAKYRNARLSYFNHDFLWAKSQLDVLRASTSKLIANDAMKLSLLISDNMEEDSTFTMLERYAHADLLLYRGLLDSAWVAFDDIGKHSLSHPILDEVLMQKAHIRMRQGQYAEADSLLKKLIDFYGDDILADDALFTRAELNEQQLRNNAVAQQCYEQLLLNYPSSLYTDRARRRYEQLKRKNAS